MRSEYYDDEKRSRTYLERIARESRCTVVYSNCTTLLLDIDRPYQGEQWDQTDNLIRILSHGHLSPCQIRHWASRSNNTHVEIRTLRRMTMEERLMLQAMLGSDPVREMIAYIRYLNDEPDPIVLFKPITTEVEL